MPSIPVTFLAAAGAMSFVSLAGVTATRSADALPLVTMAQATASDNNLCRVEVLRGFKPGTVDVSRKNLEDGSCVCIAKTGEAKQNGSAESVVADLLRTRECSNAPLAGVLETGGLGSGGGILPILGGAAAAVGAVALLSKSSG
jgi:hypothetical protein